MKQKFIIFLLLVAGFNFTGIQAQEKQATIIGELEKFVPGEGIIKIISDPKIKELIGTMFSETSADKESFIVTYGFRIQVFMSNDWRTARRECSEKRNLIREVYSESEISVYDEYNPPNWKLVVGDFLTREEADIFKQRLLKSIPKLGREMYIVQDRINIPIQKNY